MLLTIFAAVFSHVLAIIFLNARMRRTQSEHSQRVIISIYVAFSIIVAFAVGFTLKYLEYYNYLFISGMGFILLPWVGVFILWNSTRSQ